MSVSLSRSTSFCSHSSSPSCSPPPCRIQSPSSTRKAQIPRSTANSPLPFLLTKSDKFVFLGGTTGADATPSSSSSHHQQPSVSGQASATALEADYSSTGTPIRRSHRGTKDASRLAKRKQVILPAPTWTEACRAPTTMAPAPAPQGIDSVVWHRRRGRTAEVERLDSSSGSEPEEGERENRSADQSPVFDTSGREQALATAETEKASVQLALKVDSHPQHEPLPGGLAAALSSAHGLERNFETKVSMTPPARMSVKHNQSPFNATGLSTYPATEVRNNSIPRSHAFGPLAPLPLDDIASKSARRSVLLHCRTALAVDGLPYDGGQRERTLDLLQGKGGPEGNRHMRARTEGQAKKGGKVVMSSLETVQEPRRRAATTLRSEKDFYSMEMDDSEELDDAPPPSPSPACDLSFPPRFNISEEESSTESDSDGTVLRPGARIVPRRLGSSRSISTSHCEHDVPSMIGFGGEIPVRSFTTSALKNSSQSSLSPSHSATKLAISQQNKSSSSSPYKTPNKRRARMPSSTSGSRSRTLSAASPVSAPQRCGEDSLFGGAMPIGLEEWKIEPNQTSRESKRRSTGSLFPSTPASGVRLFSEASPAASLSSPSRPHHSSIPPSSPSTSSQRKLALTRLDCSSASPNVASLGFDDSGVAFSSPITCDSKLTERALGKHLGLATLGRPNILPSSVPESPSQSPSKAALSRRTVSDHLPSAHPFSVRERSSLAKETRMSDAGSSTASTPEVMRKSGRMVASANSVPDSLASPVRHAGSKRTSLSASSLTVEESTAAQAPYLTPQNYKNVVPLQAAFMSTGLASKRNRPSMANVDLVTGESMPPLPPQPNYTLGASTANPSTSSSTAQLGLREVVAAANAHLAANNKPATMPDTPMKKPGFPAFGGHAAKGTPLDAAKSKTRKHPTLPAMLSPSLPPRHNDGAESSSSGGSVYGGDSPLLNQGCESPTLGLASVTGNQSWAPGPRPIQSPFKLTGSMIDSFPHSLSPPKPTYRFSTSPEIQLHGDEKDGACASEDLASSTNTKTSNTLPLVGFARPSSLRGKSTLMHRPALGLQRKSSFGPAPEQGFSLSNSGMNSPVLGNDFIPTTPTRNSASIKWFEAAQLVTTPSPSSRRRVSKGRPESYQSSNRSSRLRLSIGAPDTDSEKNSPMSIARVFHFESRFTVQSTLGKGEFSQVDKVEDKLDGCLYAVKRMKKPYLGPRDRLRRLEEVDILSHLSQGAGHLNIISLVDAWEEAGSLFIQTELCPCVDFSSFLQHNSNMGGSLEEARLWKVFKELSDGLAYIHEMGVLHLDLKPANIFITEIATLKIGDFGLATRWPTVDANTILAGAAMGDKCDLETNALTAAKGKNLEREGDREYIAPEIIFEGRYSKAADVFSLGLILLEAAGNVVLPDNGEAWQKLRNDDLSDVDLSIFSTSLVRLIEACLHSMPEKRPTMEHVQRHPVLLAVSRRVALGVQVSELDQLPIFDLQSGDSSRSLSSKFRIEEVVDTEMSEGGKDKDKDVGTHAKTSQTMERSTSARSALGLMGVEGIGSDEGERVLDIRGALIHESIDFLTDILESEPDAHARLTGSALEIPKISIEGGQQELAAGGGAGNAGLGLHHLPFRASPLRQEGDEGDCDMELD